jgi:hypothetical protein
MLGTGSYKGVKYHEIDGRFCIIGCSGAPGFWSIGAMQRWIDNNVVWNCPRDAGG